MSATNRKIMDRLRVPPVNWNDVFEKIPKRDRERYAGSLMALAQAAARMAGYFNRRALGHDHAAAVRNSNRCVAAVRKALGYTYARNDINF